MCFSIEQYIQQSHSATHHRQETLQRHFIFANLVAIKISRRPAELSFCIVLHGLDILAVHLKYGCQNTLLERPGLFLLLPDYKPVFLLMGVRRPC